MNVRTYYFHHGTTVQIMRFIIPLFAAWLTYMAWRHGDACGVTFSVVLFLFATIGLSFNFITEIDPARNEVRRTTGFWGVPGKTRTFRFDEFTRVELTRDETQFQVRLYRGPKHYDLTHGGAELDPDSRELAEMLGTNFVDRTENDSRG